LYSKFQTDTDVEQKGVILDYGDGNGRIRIRRAGGANHAFIKALEKVSRSHRAQIQHNLMSPDESLHIMVEVYASTVVLGWEGVTGEDGKPLPFSKENCMKLFKDLPDLFRDVQEQAQNVSLFRANLSEADAKN
jgi:hypothetical protein